MKINSYNQTKLKFETISGDLEKLKNNPDLELTIKTFENALFHIKAILETIAGEITEMKKRVKNIPKDPIL